MQIFFLVRVLILHLPVRKDPQDPSLSRVSVLTTQTHTRLQRNDHPETLHVYHPPLCRAMLPE